MVQTKKVNIKANIPIKNVNPPIYGVRTGITMTISDIMKCLMRRAIVDEILSDGSIVRLNDRNFRTDFEGQLQARLKAEEEANKFNLDDLDDDDDPNNDNDPDNEIIDEQPEDTINEEPVNVVSTESDIKEPEAVEGEAETAIADETEVTGVDVVNETAESIPTTDGPEVAPTTPKKTTTSSSKKKSSKKK